MTPLIFSNFSNFLSTVPEFRKFSILRSQDHKITRIHEDSMHSIFNGRESRNQYTICLERTCAGSYSWRGRSATEVKSRLDSATYGTHRGRKQTIRKGVRACSKRKVVRFGLCCFVDGCFQAFCKCIVCRRASGEDDFQVDPIKCRRGLDSR